MLSKHPPCPKFEAWSVSLQCWSSEHRTRLRWWDRAPAGTSCPWTGAAGRTCPPLCDHPCAGREINLYWPTCVPDDDVLEQVAVGHGCWFVKEGGRHHRELLVGEQLLCVTWDWRRRMRRRNYRKNRLLPSFLTVSPPPRLGSLLRSATGCAIVLPPVTGRYGQEDTRDKERKCSGFLPFFVLPATELRASLPLLFTLTTEKLFAAFSLGPTIPFAKRSIQKQPRHCNALQSWPNCIARHSIFIIGGVMDFTADYGLKTRQLWILLPIIDWKPIRLQAVSSTYPCQR